MHEESLWMRRHPETHKDLKNLLILLLYSYIPVLSFCSSPYKSWHFLWRKGFTSGMAFSSLTWGIRRNFLSYSLTLLLLLAIMWENNKWMSLWSIFLDILRLMSIPCARRKALFWCFSNEYAIGVEIVSHLQWFPTKQGCCRAPGLWAFSHFKAIFLFFSLPPQEKSSWHHVPASAFTLTFSLDFT